MFMGRRFFPLLLVGIFGFMLLGGIRSSAYRAGFAQGVYVGETRTEQVAPAMPDGPAAEAAPNPANPAYGPRGYGAEYGPYGHGHHHYGFGFFRLLLTFALLGFIFKMFKYRAWHHRRGRWGHHGGPRGPHWHKNHDNRSEKERKADEAAANRGDGDYVSM